MNFHSRIYTPNINSVLINLPIRYLISHLYTYMDYILFIVADIIATTSTISNTTRSAIFSHENFSYTWNIFVLGVWFICFCVSVPEYLYIYCIYFFKVFSNVSGVLLPHLHYGGGIIHMRLSRRNTYKIDHLRSPLLIICFMCVLLVQKMVLVALCWAVMYAIGTYAVVRLLYNFFFSACVCWIFCRSARFSLSLTHSFLLFWVCYL